MSRRPALAQIHELTDRIVRPPLNLRTCRQAVRSARSSRPRRLMPSPTGDETGVRSSGFLVQKTEAPTPEPLPDSRAPSLRCPLEGYPGDENARNAVRTIKTGAPV